jgi:hypothetical protein
VLVQSVSVQEFTVGLNYAGCSAAVPASGDSVRFEQRRSSRADSLECGGHWLSGRYAQLRTGALVSIEPLRVIFDRENTQEFLGYFTRFPHRLLTRVVHS